MCCDGWNYGEAVGVCPACDEPVNADGDAVEGCFWSPLICEICGASPCDQSC